MTDTIPAIRVTDPQSRDTVPETTGPNRSEGFDYAAGSRSASPKEGRHQGEVVTEESPRLTGGASGSRPSTSGGLPNPGKLLRSLSGTLSNQEEPVANDRDPLSQHLFRRVRPTSSGASAPSEDRSDDNAISRSNTTISSAGKEKKKGASFLGRLLGNKKKETDDNVIDDAASEYSNLRPEGMEANVFSQPVDNIEFNPRHPPPPEYIRVRARNKKDKDFDHLFLAQELLSSNAHHGETPVWAMQFSRDGRYLAAAGQDKIIRVWEVIRTQEDRKSHAEESDINQRPRLSAPVFRQEPIREYEGHTSTILDLSWSKNNFLLSSSMDKNVRLWHVSRDECLCTFKHSDFVTSIAFHPKDDRFFLAGSLDSKLRLWSIPDKTVAYWSQLPDMITAVAFTPDGKYAMAGCFTGLCMFYETEGLKYQTQIHARSRNGKNAKGSKITGIQSFHSGGETKVLISSNDSRIRLYNFRDKSLEIKFKGNVNDSSQIRAAISDDAKYIFCGSEDHKVYIWPTDPGESDKKQKRPMETFDASNTVVTCVAFAPPKSKQLLGRSEDPIYDLCNPPPVMLMSSAERAGSRPPSRAPTEDGIDTELQPQKRPDESPAYLARSTHVTGNIIVTADLAGKIKVFRQDCAWNKRKTENWETSSVFSKRKLGRTASIATKGSSRSLRSSHGRLEGPADRILSWRQGISSTPNIANGSIRSQSPRKSTASAQPRPDSKASMAPPPLPKNDDRGDGEEDNDPLMLQGDQSMLYWKLALNSARNHQNQPQPSPQSQQPSQSGRPSSTRTGSYNLGLPHPHPLQRNHTAVSKLSIEQESAAEDSDSDAASFKDALQGHEEQVTCRECGSANFHVKAAKTGDTRLCCSSCGAAA
ncbi:WD40 repeat-like protein [Aureobasidium pullulans]|uniref:WD40 repeat-like protein n=1 Tax=Aureobasidium pullulans TaxID=5580 RepID=A0A4S9RZQ6_AURPU|nr:WD40 repeat-like protein [Aureobasidium pullulans]THZ03086.1 WD40 repeat-like protein [Aureobasidium pullulans]THZ88118.1 WD40 repeat-like protein [Aureobasidium pullulans]TIA24333.1 WD40 repeat-like protein [Aureobasidium pullulans]